MTSYVPNHDQARCSLRAVWKLADTLPNHVEVIAQALVNRVVAIRRPVDRVTERLEMITDLAMAATGEYQVMLLESNDLSEPL